MRELSTDTQIAWVERVFKRMSALYGASFGRQWDGTDFEDVKRVWAEKLGNFQGNEIRGALDACDDRPYPPTLPEFIALARACVHREPERLSIGGPQISREEQGERAREVAAAVKKPDAYDWLGWAKRLRERYLSGKHLIDCQIKLASGALMEEWKGGQCNPAKPKAEA